jgi:tetratricopeptide (TPR) repeat protein
MGIEIDDNTPLPRPMLYGGGVKHDKSARRRNRGRETAAAPVAHPETIRRAGKHALLVAALIGFMLAAYSNSIHAPFLLDNNGAILKDERIRTAAPANVYSVLAGEYQPDALSGLYRPLTTLSFMFNYAVLGNEVRPAGYHWLNLILHAVNMALVYALGLVIFEGIPAAFLLAAVWGLHPVLTESVTNIVGRADMLAAFGVLAALLCHRKAMRAERGWKAAWLAALALAVTVGMFSKESAITVVAVMALYDLAFARAFSWRSRLPGYAAAAVPGLVYLYVRAQVLAQAVYQSGAFVDNPLVGVGFWTARATAVKVIGKYLQLLAWPAQLSCDYSYNAIPLFGWRMNNAEDWKAVAALLVCAAAAVVALRAYRSHRPVFFFILFFFATLAPVSNVVILIGTIMGERFLYLPSVGFAALVVPVLLALWRRIPDRPPAYRYAALAAVGVMLTALAARTYARNFDWLDRQRFWRSAIEAAPGAFFPHTSAAINTALLKPEDWDRSIRETDRALAILEGLPDLQNTSVAYLDAGVVYRSVGERLASTKTAEGAVAGTSAEDWYRRSLYALWRAERIELAQDERKRRENARRGKPAFPSVASVVYLHLGRAYMRLSDLPNALAAYERGRSLAADPELLEDLAAAYHAAGQPRQAALALVEAVAVDASRSQLISTIVDLYRAVDPGGCAVGSQGGAPSLNLDCPLVHGDICTASRNVAGTYRRGGHFKEAAAVGKTAMKDFGCTVEAP